MKNINFKKYILISVFLVASLVGNSAQAAIGLCVVTLSDGTVRKAYTDTQDNCDRLLKKLQKYYHDNGATNEWLPPVNGATPQLGKDYEL